MHLHMVSTFMLTYGVPYVHPGVATGEPSHVIHMTIGVSQIAAQPLVAPVRRPTLCPERRTRVATTRGTSVAQKIALVEIWLPPGLSFATQNHELATTHDSAQGFRMVVSLGAKPCGSEPETRPDGRRVRASRFLSRRRQCVPTGVYAGGSASRSM